jgi:predicted phage terminase large subunit-like protein
MKEIQRKMLDHFRVTILENKYIPVKPFSKQAQFIMSPQREGLYGGAAFGGKSVCLAMCALQYVDVPGYNAVLFRRTNPQLTRADGLVPLLESWLLDSDARYNKTQRLWTFPSTATLRLDQLQHDHTVHEHQGAQYQFIGFDELTHFYESQYRYMMSRLRKPKEMNVPLRTRSTANPGGLGHNWVYDRFVNPETAKDPERKKRVFVPARVEDNVAADVDEYDKTLQNLTKIDYTRLRHGDWTSQKPGEIITIEMIQENLINPSDIPKSIRLIRYWDLASSAITESNRDPDWTAGALVGESERMFYVVNVKRFREEPYKRDLRIRGTARTDGKDITVWFQRDPGQAGKSQIFTFQRDVLPEFLVEGDPKRTSKVIDWEFIAQKLEAGLVKIVKGPWNMEMETEFCELTRDDQHAHDDMADAVSGALRVLAESEAAYVSFEPPSGSLDDDEREEEGDDSVEFAFV